MDIGIFTYEYLYNDITLNLYNCSNIFSLDYKKMYLLIIKLQDKKLLMN